MPATEDKEKTHKLDLKGLMCPIPIVMTSEKMKRLKEGEILEVEATDPGFEKDIWNWCKQTGNELLSLSKDKDITRAVIKKTATSHEPSIVGWIKFHSLGVKLHIKYYLIKFLPFIKKPDHFITFVAISEGLKAEKFLKNIGEKDTKLLPVPDEIDPHCGVVIGVKGIEKAKAIYELLNKKGFGVEAIYRYEKGKYEKIYPQ